MGLWGPSKMTMVTAAEALAGSAVEIAVPERHEVLGTALKPPFPAGIDLACFALGCFWGAERLFWKCPGVHSTSVGYAGGFTVNPTYEQVCTARTGHAEAVLVAFDPALIDYGSLLRLFWESHDPTQGMRQGNDIGTQYRSAIYWTSESQRDRALASRDGYDRALRQAGFGPATTEIAHLDRFYWAEDYHQQYLAKNPGGYCGLGGTGIHCVGGDV